MIPEEKDHISTTAMTCADGLYAEDPTHSQGMVVVLTTPHNWDYQPDSPDIRKMSRFLTCVIAGMKKASFTAANYDNILEITQGPDENPVAFMSCLNEAVLKYTNLDPGSAEGSLYLHTHFINHSAPDIWEKLQKLEGGPQTPQRELIKMAFWVFDNREEEKKLEQEKRDKEGE